MALPLADGPDGVPTGSDPVRGPTAKAADSAPEALVGTLGFEVVSRLVSVGLILSAARRLVGDGPAGERLDRAVDELDEAIAQIRIILLWVVSGDPDP